jgi:tetratricopeptide (TPR) repeat protein
VKEDEARVACLNGEYTQGVAILSELFVKSKNPTYIFNQGRCFKQNRRYEDAIARFQEYLRVGRKKLDASDKAEAEQHIADCREMLAQQRDNSAVPTAPQASLVPPPAAVPGSAAEPRPEPSITTQPAPQPKPTSSGAGLRIGGIVVASLGVAALGAGVACNLTANSMVDDMYSTSDGYAKESDRKTHETLAWVGYGVGAAGVVTGAILYAVGVRARSKSAGSVALVPTVGADHAGASLVGAF